MSAPMFKKWKTTKDRRIAMSEHIPERIKQAIDLHVTEGRPCGHFTTAVLQNDLLKAITHADTLSLECIGAIVIYCYNFIPSPSWGSPKAVADWIKKGGDENGLRNAR